MKQNLILTPDNARAFERSLDMLDSGIREMYRVAYNMMPEVLVKSGLDAALNDLCNEVGQNSAVHISYQSAGIDQAVPDQAAAITLYRIVQQLVDDAIKQFMAANLQVTARTAGKQLLITVQHDGQVPDVSLLKQSGNWNIIEQGVLLLKGKIEVSSTAAQGTTILIETHR